ncbi:hypothetical protein D0809_08520 [Flavobacterium circumlabens]|uniref:Uncharacterized protein n=1 Tax=Flavobacterium circumlabens TaxID=2133765 RepID=A0A4Y7UH71_9FLAO|nr:hypothetical protein [Flavobacterium circumlabens]TCN59958.1 hypothetical protein EV142_102578 [Flavobacterium circumlabens]TEB45202.1 hypothetical protein D0809_08520 [Flavobacterium circumlabens]
MDSIYKKFYRHFYLKTAGFIPTKPLNQSLFPGDYFQIKNGEIIVLGNLYRNTIIAPEEADLSAAVLLNAWNWNFSEGISKPYSGRGHGHSAIEGQFEFSKQILAFAHEGSFIFKAEEPQSIKINNWNEIQQQLIIKLTQTLFSFREIYIVTESATAAHTTLAIAGEKNAELEFASETENFGLVDIFGHPDTKTIQSKDIEYYHRETKRKPAYFKAKKLVVQDDKLAFFVSDFITKTNNSSEWTDTFYDSNFHNDADYSSQIILQNAQGHFLDMLQANELNPNTALLYFKWADANLDDVEKLFANYGN